MRNHAGQYLPPVRCYVQESRLTDLNDVMETTSDLFGRSKERIFIHRKYQKGLWPVKAGRRQLERILLTLYVNAANAMPAGGDLYLETMNVVLDENGRLPCKSGRYVKVSVTDTGMGQRVFEPFFTAKGGADAGLDMIHGTLRELGGFVHLCTGGIGTSFNLYLPAPEGEEKITATAGRRSWT